MSLKFKNATKSALSVFFSVLFWAVIVLAVLRISFDLLYFKVYVIGSSMSSTLTGADDSDTANGDYVYAFYSSSPRRGDIVIIETPYKTVINNKIINKTIIKRVIALGGDDVELKEGVLYLNGNIVDEPYVLSENNTPEKNNYPKRTVKQGEMFCMGDNRDDSIDSRDEKYGCMPVSWTVGVVANWSLSFKEPVTAFNRFFDFTLPSAFRR